MSAEKPAGVWRSSLRLWRTRIGIALVLLLVGVAIVGPWVAKFSPSEFAGTPNTRHVPGTWLGTDYLGQDVVSGSASSAPARARPL